MVNRRRLTWIAMTIFVGLLCAGPLFSKVEFVDVTLKSGEVIRFEPSSFQIDWVFPVTIMEEDTCIQKVLQVEDIKVIFPISKSWNSCKEKEDWLYEVDFPDDNYIQGYVASESKSMVKAEGLSKEHAVCGTIYSTGKKALIDYEQIRKISFVRGE
jgi:5'(3')-deoxyribonucleotidase